MKQYIFFPTWNDHWYDISIKLKEEKIAEPFLWIGDPKHYQRAKIEFGEEVVKDRDFFVFKSHQISNTNYNGKFNDFFFSTEYMITKDRAIKMMDRLDELSMISRIDREAIFNNTVMWTLNKFEKKLPDALIAIEHPHTHIQFTIFQICKYFNIQCVKFNSWLPIPVINLQNVNTGELINRTIEFDDNIVNEYNSSFKKYIQNIYNKRDNYIANHIEIVKLRSNLASWKIQNLISFVKDIFRKFKSKKAFEDSKRYNPVNPFKIDSFQKLRLIRKRRKNLESSLNKNAKDDVSLDVKYVYFGLHYEPERTTLPDGGVFHDQLLSIIKLRDILPDNVKVYVKEHPSMFFKALTGYKGRSPIFYDLIRNISGVTLVHHNVSTLNLIKNSVFTATVTGTVGFESSILGKKSIIFGNSWYDGCPNTLKWNDDLSYAEIINAKVLKKEIIIEFFENLFKEKCAIGFLNSRTEFRLAKYRFNGFEKIQFDGAYNLISQFLTRL